MLSQRGRLPCVPRGMGPALNVSRCPSELVAVQRSPGSDQPNATSKAEGTEPPKVSTVSKPPIAARVAGSGQHLGFWQEQSAHRLLSFMAFKLPTWSFQHVASKNLGAFIGGGTRTQFRCVGAGGRRRWRGRRWQWSRWSERRSRNQRQLKRLDKRSERQQRCSTPRRSKQSNWQHRGSTPRQHGPK